MLRLMITRAIVVAIGLAALGQHLAFPVTAVGAGGSAAWLPGLTSSEALTGPTLAQGRLTGSDGQPVAGRLVAVAWPPMAILGSVPDGGTVRTTPIAKATAGADGRFTLRVDPAAPLTELLEPDGTINLDIFSLSGSDRASFALARRLDGHDGRWLDPSLEGVAADGPGASVKVVLGNVPAGGSQPNPGVPLPAPATDRDFGCTNYALATYNSIITAIGETYPGSHATVQFVYTNGSSSSLGVGVSASGDYGSFSASGTASASSTVTLSWPSKPANSLYIYETTFQYKKFDVWTLWDYGCIHWDYETRPTGFQGAVTGYNACCAPGVSYSSAIAAGATVTKSTARAVTWSDAVKIGGSIGINLSGQTGYNTNTELKFPFFANGSLWGDTDYYPNAHRIVGR